MKILDRYILRKFLLTFLFTILAIMVIAVVVDSSEKADDFVKSGLKGWQIIRRYYFGFVPHIIALIFPLIVFISVILFTSQMAGRTEIVAILAGGISFRRMLWPFIMGGILLGGVLWLANRYVVPHANVIRANFQAKYIDANSSYDQTTQNRNTIFYRREDSNTYIGIRFYDTATRTASGFFLERVKENKVVYNMRSETMRWDASNKTWKLENALEREINGLKERLNLYPSMTIQLSITPADLRNDEYLKDKLTTPELAEFIRKEKIRGSEGLNALQVERFRRDATPVSVLILVLIAAIIASRKIRGGSGMHLAIGIVLGTFFILLDRFSTVFSVKGNFPPLLAAWIPNIIFLLVALWLYRRAPK
jgi:lipopolysaccharide export system permease protein